MRGRSLGLERGFEEILVGASKENPVSGFCFKLKARGEASGRKWEGGKGGKGGKWKAENGRRKKKKKKKKVKAVPAS